MWGARGSLRQSGLGTVLGDRKQAPPVQRNFLGRFARVILEVVMSGSSM